MYFPDDEDTMGASPVYSRNRMGSSGIPIILYIQQPQTRIQADISTPLSVPPLVVLVVGLGVHRR